MTIPLGELTSPGDEESPDVDGVPPGSPGVLAIDETQDVKGQTWSEGPEVYKTGPPRDVDRDRYLLAVWVLCGFIGAGALLFLLIVILPPEKLETLRGTAPLILSPLATLAGTGFAWFYADRHHRS